MLGDNRGNSLDSREFGPVPLHTVRGHAAAFTMTSNPRWWWDWEKIPKMETDAFTVKDPREREATRHKWEGISFGAVGIQAKALPSKSPSDSKEVMHTQCAGSQIRGKNFQTWI